MFSDLTTNFSFIFSLLLHKMMNTATYAQIKKRPEIKDISNRRAGKHKIIQIFGSFNTNMLELLANIKYLDYF